MDGRQQASALEVGRHTTRGRLPCRDKAKAVYHSACAVWNYEERAVQVWEITQRSLQESLHLLTKDKDFGPPINYDLKITRKGDGLETTYSMVPMPGDMNDDVQNAIAELRVNLEALLHAVKTHLRE